MTFKKFFGHKDNPGMRQGKPGMIIEKKQVPKEDLFCIVCNVLNNSVDQMNVHFSGSKHKDKVREHILAGPEAASQQMGHKSLLQRSEDLFCTVCNKEVNSIDQMEAHISGYKHKDKVREQILTGPAATTTKTKMPSIKMPSNTKKPLEQEHLLDGLNCTVCKVTLTDEDQKEGHLNGKKHKAKAALAMAATTKKIQMPSDTKLENEKLLDGLNCTVCKVTLTAEDQKEDHLNGKKHKAKAALFMAEKKEEEDLLAKDTNPDAQMEVEEVPSTTLTDSELNKELTDSEPNKELTESEPNKELTESEPNKTPQEEKALVPRVKCEVCDIDLSSATQLALHKTGRKHKNKVSYSKLGLVPTQTGGKQENKVGTNPGGKGVGKGNNPFNPHLIKKDENSSLSDPALKKVKPEGKVVIIKSMKDLEWHFRRAMTSPSTSLRDIIGDKNATIDELWMNNHECYCGLCLVLIQSKQSAHIHFTSIKHKGKAKVEGEEGGSPEEWCKVCRVNLASSYAANLHYKGEKHRSKIMIVSKLSAHDEDIAERLNPMGGKHANYQPGFGYLGNKRPSFAQDEGPHQGGPPPPKRRAGGSHLYSSFIPGGSINMNQPHIGPRETPWQPYRSNSDSNMEVDYHNNQPWQQGSQDNQPWQHGSQDTQPWQQRSRGAPNQQGWQSRQRPGLESSAGSGPSGGGRGRGGKPKHFNAPGAFGGPSHDKSSSGGAGEYCSACNLTLNSSGQMATHLAGAKHAEMSSGKSGILKNSADGSAKKTKVAMPVSLKALKSVRQASALASGDASSMMVTETTEFAYSGGQSGAQAGGSQSQEYPTGKQGYKKKPQDYSGTSSQQQIPSTSKSRDFYSGINSTQYPANPYSQGYSNQQYPLAVNQNSMNQSTMMNQNTMMNQSPMMNQNTMMNNYFPAGHPSYNAPGAYPNYGY